MFAMLFSVGIGFFVYTAQTTLQTAQAGQVRQQGLQQASAEKVSISVGLSTVADPWGQTGDLWLRVYNPGGSPVTLVDIFVTSTALNILASHSQVTPNSNYLQVRGSVAQKGDLNYSLPLALPPGYSTNQLKGCGSLLGCDIGISKTSYTYGGTPVVVSILTSSGNIFSGQYPPPPSSVTVSTTSTTSTASTTTITSGNPGGNVLVVQMSATPPQTFSCKHCVNDTVIVSNYGTSQVTGVTLSPAPPLISSTGTLSITSNGACTLVGGVNNIPAYSGSGSPPSITYLCNFGANPNGFGGFASFTGSASGTYNGSPVTSGVAISNTIQVGGPVNVLNQGPFSGNFFFFKYSACTSAPTPSTPCTTTPSPVTFNKLPTANAVKGSSSYYVAFYVQITNNFNVTIPILPYSYFQVDATVGSDSPFFLVGNPASLPYVPNYNPGGNNIPTLTPYPSTCIASSTSTCINLAPGASVTLTFAACDISSTWWDWAGHTYGSSFDSGATCTTSPPGFASNIATYGSIIITFPYQGQVYTQDIPFVGLLVQ